MMVTERDLIERLPVLKLPDGRVVSLLTIGYVPWLPENEFGKLTPELQKEGVRLLKNFLQACYGLPEGPTKKEAEFRHEQIDGVSWQLAKYLRNSKPTRITEAIELLTYVTEAYKRHRNNKVTVVPTLYLGVALSKVGGKEDEAIKAFDEGLANLSYDGPNFNLLWAGGNYAQMLRRMNKVAEAQEQEHLTRQWILKHPFEIAPSRIIGALADVGTNILDHPDVKAHFAIMIELDTKNWFYGHFLITKLDAH